MAIGAPDNDGNGVDAGHVHVYAWSGTAWEQLGADIDGEATRDGAGHSVALDGNRLIVGAPYNDGKGREAGHVKTYEWSGSAWVQMGVDIDGETAGDKFGRSVSLNGDRLAVGAPKSSGEFILTGHVRVYAWSGTAWEQLGGTIEGEEFGGYLGTSVAIDGDRLTVGVPRDESDRDQSGHTRVYEWSGTAWEQLGKNIEGETEGDLSGYSVTLDGNRVAVGTPANSGAEGLETGRVRIYEWRDTAWVQLAMDMNGEAQFDRSGTSVSLDGNRVAIGSFWNDGNGEKAGHVRVYELKPLDKKDK